MKIHRAFSRILRVILAAVLVLSLSPAALAAAPQASSNVNRQQYQYNRWSAPVRSYLYENQSGGLTRVEYDGKAVIIEDYNNAFQLLSARTLQLELPIWGGFFAGKDYNFVVCGQENKEQNDAKEVIRVIKYGKNWTRLGSDSLYGANTIIPFEGGSLRCGEYGGWLYIRTCHEMYASQDGRNHQANLMIAVRQDDMEITDSFYLVESGVGYVSHSFNQFILVDAQGRIVTLDHGDAYPRSALLQRYTVRAGQDSFRLAEKDKWIWIDVGGGRREGRPAPASEEAELVVFPGGIGDNDTGAALGGLEETSKGYVAAYNYDGVGGTGNTRDIYLAFVGDDLSVSTRRLTTGVLASTPQSVAMTPDSGYVLWNQGTSAVDSWGYVRTAMSDTLCYAAYASDGTLGAVQTAAAPLSDCKPIAYQGKAVWYVTSGSAPVFYTLDKSGVKSVQATAANTGSNTAQNIAYPAAQTVRLDGKDVTLQCYALQDAAGGRTNYVRIRDLALAMDTTPARFSVDWDGARVVIEPGVPYQPNGTENHTPYSGTQPYTTPRRPVYCGGRTADLDCIDIGSGNTYYQLREVGKLLDFNVKWDSAAGRVVIDTASPYTGQ